MGGCSGFEWVRLLVWFKEVITSQIANQLSLCLKELKKVFISTPRDHIAMSRVYIPPHFHLKVTLRPSAFLLYQAEIYRHSRSNIPCQQSCKLSTVSPQLVVSVFVAKSAFEI